VRILLRFTFVRESCNDSLIFWKKIRLWLGFWKRTVEIPCGFTLILFQRGKMRSQCYLLFSWRFDLNLWNSFELSSVLLVPDSNPSLTSNFSSASLIHFCNFSSSLLPRLLWSRWGLATNLTLELQQLELDDEDSIESLRADAETPLICFELLLRKPFLAWMFLRFLSFLSLLWILIQLNWRENIGICLWGVFCWMVIMWRFAQWPAFYRLPCVLLTNEKMTCGLWTASVALDLKWANLQYYVKFGLNCNFI